MTRPHFLVSGGAGYVGSHIVHAAVDQGYQVTVLDDLSKGVLENLPPEAEVVQGDIGDQALLNRLLTQIHPDVVIHAAAFISVPESLRDPALYYQANTHKAAVFFEACARHGVSKVIYSSTAAVYGIPGKDGLVSEKTPLAPINPYGRSKEMAERILLDIAQANGRMQVAVLRYFNVAGADPAGRTGQSGKKTDNLIRAVCEVATGRRDHISIFGNDYDTPDGTGVRDYIHVSDIAQAHLDTFLAMKSKTGNLVMNCGIGHGYSVAEVISAVERQIGRSLPKKIAPRRAGDPPCVVAAATLIRETTGWAPQFSDLDTIVLTALTWEHQLAAGTG